MKCDLEQHFHLGVKLQLQFKKIQIIQWWLFLPSEVTPSSQLTGGLKLIFLEGEFKN